MLLLEMSSPIVLSSKSWKLPTNSCKTAHVMAEVTMSSMALLVAAKVFRKRKGDHLSGARRDDASKWLQMIFLMATTQMMSISSSSRRK